MVALEFYIHEHINVPAYQLLVCVVFSSGVYWVVCGARGLHTAYDAILVLGTKEVAKEETTLLRKPTVRHICCAVLLPATSKTIRCTNCEAHRHTLRSLSCRVETPSAVEKTAPDSHVNYRFLSTPEKTVRLKRIHSELRYMQLKKERLKTKLEKVVEEEGIVVDSEMHADLRNIMTTNETEIKKTSRRVIPTYILEAAATSCNFEKCLLNAMAPSHHQMVPLSQTHLWAGI